MKQRVFSVIAELLTLNSTAIPQGHITATLRLGRVHATSTCNNSQSATSLELGMRLQVNVDSSALQNQRCTVTLTRQDKGIIGIALVSLPRDTGQLSGTYKLNQSADKKAELSLKFTISPMDSTIPLKQLPKANPEPVSETLAVSTPRPQQKERFLSSLSKLKSAGMKPTEQQQTIKILESELSRLKNEKDVYYQLYQIEKSKSEMAGKFVSNFIAKMKQEHPDMIKQIADFSMGLVQKGRTKEGNAAKQQESQALKQMDQANRSLHRQVQQYKKINQQLKKQLCRNETNGRTNNLMPPGGIEELFPNTKSNIKGKNSNILSSLRSEVQSPSPLAEVDLKKWLEESVGQREKLQKFLQSLPKDVNDAPPASNANLAKIRAAVNKAYVSLMSKGTFNRESILGHKREINSILDEMLTS